MEARQRVGHRGETERRRERDITGKGVRAAGARKCVRRAQCGLRARPHNCVISISRVIPEGASARENAPEFSMHERTVWCIVVMRELDMLSAGPEPSFFNTTPYGGVDGIAGGYVRRKWGKHARPLFELRRQTWNERAEV